MEAQHHDLMAALARILGFIIGHWAKPQTCERTGREEASGESKKVEETGANKVVLE